MSTLFEFLKNFLLSPVGTFSTILSVLSIAAWLIVIGTRKVTRLELSQKHLEEGHKEVVKKIDQLSADMQEGFQKMEKRFEKVDERFEKMEQKMDERFEKVDERFEKMEQKMDERFEKVDERFEKMDKKFDRKIELLSEKLDKNTEELRKDIAGLRTDVRILQHDRYHTKTSALRAKSYRQGNKKKAVAGF